MSTNSVSTEPTILSTSECQEREASHQSEVSRYTKDFLARRRAGVKDPVEDFLFTYYSHSPGQLSRWHPGAGYVLEGAGNSTRSQWKFYTTVEDGTPAGGCAVDVVRFSEQRASLIEFTRRLLRATADRPARLSCFGLHEWAMIYKSGQHGKRHHEVPLRLGAEGTDDVVESLDITCTHYDAFRFYTASAKPFNKVQPTRQSQLEMEQPGCLHVNMDLYKWAYKLIPAVSSELLLECFDLAWRIREMDMRASPYELSQWNHEPIRIETPAGRAEYARAQKAFSDEAQILRYKILAAVEKIEELASAPT